MEGDSAAAEAASFVAYLDDSAAFDQVYRAERLPTASVRDFVVGLIHPGSIGHLVGPFGGGRAHRIVWDPDSSVSDLVAVYDMLAGHNCRTRCRNLHFR